MSIANVVGWMRPTDGDVISAARRQDMATLNGSPGKRLAEEYSVPVTSGQADGRALLVALETIANWPVAEQDNMQAANMRKLAQDALRGRATQPATKYDDWAAMLALSEQPEIAQLLEAFSHDSTEDNAVYLVREVARAVSPGPASPAHGDLAQRILEWLGKNAKENSASLLLYEAMKALKPPVAAAATPEQQQ